MLTRKFYWDSDTNDKWNRIENTGTEAKMTGEQTKDGLPLFSIKTTKNIGHSHEKK